MSSKLTKNSAEQDAKWLPLLPAEASTSRNLRFNNIEPRPDVVGVPPRKQTTMQISDGLITEFKTETSPDLASALHYALDGASPKRSCSDTEPSLDAIESPPKKQKKWKGSQEAIRANPLKISKLSPDLAVNGHAALAGIPSRPASPLPAIPPAAPNTNPSLPQREPFVAFEPLSEPLSTIIARFLEPILWPNPLPPPCALPNVMKTIQGILLDERTLLRLDISCDMCGSFPDMLPNSHMTKDMNRLLRHSHRLINHLAEVDDWSDEQWTWHIVEKQGKLIEEMYQKLRATFKYQTMQSPCGDGSSWGRPRNFWPEMIGSNNGNSGYVEWEGKGEEGVQMGGLGRRFIGSGGRENWEKNTDSDVLDSMSLCGGKF